MTRKATALLTILILVLSLVVGYLWLEIRNARQSAILPVFSKQYSVVAGGIDWRLNNFQPVVKGFLEEDGMNYVLVGFTDENKKLREAKLFVSGNTPNGYQIETIILQIDDGQIEKLNFEQLKKRLPKGRQIRAEYINSLPEFLDTKNCGAVGENFRDLCFLTDVLANQTNDASLETKLKTSTGQIFIVPVTYLSLKLYEN